MTHLHYSENGVITSCNPMVKHMENKLISAVIDMVEMMFDLEDCDK